MEPNPSLLPEPPEIDHIVTEDDTPVDNLASEKLQRLLTEPLYSSWAGPEPGGRSFLAAANVGVFPSVHRPPIVPDVFVSLDVTVPDDWWAKRHRTYFMWEFGKAPEVVIEIVSNRVGHETGRKMRDYAEMRATYYAIFDPQGLALDSPLCVFALVNGRYALQEDGRMPGVGLGLVLWDGVFEGKDTIWPRWIDAEGVLIPTGAERAASEKQRADAEQQRADAEQQRADAEQQRADAEQQRAEHAIADLRETQAAAAEQRALTARLAARLREMGIDPDDLDGSSSEG